MFYIYRISNIVIAMVCLWAFYAFHASSCIGGPAGVFGEMLEKFTAKFSKKAGQQLTHAAERRVEQGAVHLAESQVEHLAVHAGQKVEQQLVQVAEHKAAALAKTQVMSKAEHEAAHLAANASRELEQRLAHTAEHQAAALAQKQVMSDAAHLAAQKLTHTAEHRVEQEALHLAEHQAVGRTAALGEAAVAKKGAAVAKKGSFLKNLNPLAKVMEAKGAVAKLKAGGKGVALAAAIVAAGAAGKDMYEQKKTTGHINLGQVVKHAVAGAVKNVAHVAVLVKDLPGAVVGGEKGREHLRSDMAKLDTMADMLLKVQHYNVKDAAEKSGSDALDLITYDLATHGHALGPDELDPSARKADADAAIALAKSMSGDSPEPSQPEENPAAQPEENPAAQPEENPSPQPEGQEGGVVADAA